MRCTNSSKRIATIIALILTALSVCGCGESAYGLVYDKDSAKSAFRLESQDVRECAPSFAANLCIPGDESTSENEIDTGSDSYSAAMLFDLKGRKTLYCKHPYERLYPASMTKVLTAIVAMENCDMDQMLVADENCVMTENDVQKVKLRAGDRMTLDQALHMLLIYSANDVANLIAINVGGSVEGFADMMNEKARALGATNSHFVNPSGLHDDDHYTTAYDMYLIFNKAITFGKFIEIISMSDYSTIYHDDSGNDISYECASTNRYLKGEVNPPQAANVIGGKTGTTLAAGSCLVLMSKDPSDNSYISVVMKADNVDVMYKKTNNMLELLQ
ncbi:MAG: D-alanyl-D-alanine carboxypeptidase [Lachnospiraceae bacterium]|nr:D-alanyl-D-alanine carboxypeptidase [Lachnospiraceae bacterium]